MDWCPGSLTPLENVCLLSVQEYASFRINNEGALEGVGLLIGSDRDSGRLVRNRMH